VTLTVQCEKPGTFGFKFVCSLEKQALKDLHFVCFFRLKGLETALAVLPSGLKAELKSSVDQLVQSQGEGMA